MPTINDTSICDCGCCDACETASTMETARNRALADPARLVSEIEAFRDMIAADWFAADKGTIANLLDSAILWRARKVAAAHTACETQQ